MHRRTKVLLIVCVGIFISSLDLFIVNIAFPDIQADFGGTSLSSLSWILNAYAIVLAALLVPAGRWADAFGRKRAFLLGLAVFTLASAACAAAPSVDFLVGARIVQAAGAALMLPTSLGLLLPEFPPERRHVAIGAWAAAGGVAAAAGPPIGGLLVEASWHWVFLVNIPIGIAALIAGRRVLTEIREPEAERPDVVGGLLVAAGIAVLVLAIVKGADWGWGSAETVGGFVLAAVLIAAFVRRCMTHPAPIVEPEIVRVRSFSLAVTGAALFFVAFAAMLLGTVLFLTTVWGESVLSASLMLSVGPATAALFSVPGARLGARFGARAVGSIGSLLFALGGVWWITHLGDTPNFAGDLLPGMILGGAGVGLVNPSLTALAAASLPPERLATGTGLLTMGRQIGSALGVAVLVPILGTPTGAASFDGAWLFMLASAGGAAIALAATGPAVGVAAARPTAATAEATA
jgi:EmrB/QacA subfamily drug resistance transporter